MGKKKKQPCSVSVKGWYHEWGYLLYRSKLSINLGHSHFRTLDWVCSCIYRVEEPLLVGWSIVAHVKWEVANSRTPPCWRCPYCPFPKEKGVIFPRWQVDWFVVVCFFFNKFTACIHQDSAPKWGKVGTWEVEGGVKFYLSCYIHSTFCWKQPSSFLQCTLTSQDLKGLSNWLQVCIDLV